VNTVKQALASEQAKAKEMVLEIGHGKIGTFKTLGTPLTMHGTPSSIRHAPPLLGEHTDQILHEYLELSSSDLNDLKNKKVVA
jgi:succinate--hydroxymethylglutarate CoA-transferase